MLTEFFEALKKTIIKGETGTYTDRPLGGSYFIRNAEGALERVHEIAPRIREADSLADLRKLFPTMLGGDGRPTTILIGDHSVQAIFGDGLADPELINVQLPQSHEFEFIQKAAEHPVVFGHEELVHFLATRFRMAVDESTRSIFKQLKVQDNRGAESNVSHAKSSLGTSVEQAALLNGAEIPETIEARCAVFRNFPTTTNFVFDITIAVRHKDGGPKFYLAAIESEVVEALQFAKDQLEKELLETDWSGHAVTIAKGC